MKLSNREKEMLNKFSKKGWFFEEDVSSFYASKYLARQKIERLINLSIIRQEGNAFLIDKEVSKKILS